MTGPGPPLQGGGPLLIMAAGVGNLAGAQPWPGRRPGREPGVARDMSLESVLNGIPVFPLTEYYLFPGTVTPLHVFETRYRRMMHDLMDSSGRLVMAPCLPDAPRVEAGPALPEMGTLVEIVRTEELEDGRWLVLLLALARVRITEAPSDRLYRKVDAVVLPDVESVATDADDLRGALEDALRARAGGDIDVMPAATPLGMLADLLLHALVREPEHRRRAFRERDPAARARLALAWLAEAGDATPGDAQEDARDT